MAKLARGAKMTAGRELLEGHIEREAFRTETAVRLLEKGRPPTQYTIDVEAEKCIGCQMCMVDCAAHHAEPKDLPIVYPKSWDLLPGPEVMGDAPWKERKDGMKQKCSACMEGLGQGMEPVCVQICPFGALSIRPGPEAPGRKDFLTLIAKGSA